MPFFWQMLYANLTALETYWPVAAHPIFACAFQWIRNMPVDHPMGIVELEGRNMFVNVHGYDTLPRGECVFESHRRYIDLQYCITGGECIDFCPRDRLALHGDYDESRDFQFHESPAEFSTLRLELGDFAVFFPQDAHRPKVTDGTHPAVRKLVVKIALELLESSR